MIYYHVVKKSEQFHFNEVNSIPANNVPPLSDHTCMINMEAFINHFFNVSQ